MYNDFRYGEGDRVRHAAYGDGYVDTVDVNSKGQTYYRVYFPSLGKTVDIFDENALRHDREYTFRDVFEEIGQMYNQNKNNSKEEYVNGSKKKKDEDPVNHPSHYNAGKIEVIDFIEDKKLNFNLGNAVKYLSRCEVKQDGKKRIEDLRKAIWYIERQIATWEKEAASHA